MASSGSDIFQLICAFHHMINVTKHNYNTTGAVNQFLQREKRPWTKKNVAIRFGLCHNGVKSIKRDETAQAMKGRRDAMRQFDFTDPIQFTKAVIYNFRQIPLP